MHDTALFAKQYLEDLLSFFGLKVDVAFAIKDDVIELEIPSTYLNGFLIGKYSTTLQSIHHLTLASVQHHTQQTCRINIDVAGYKKQKERRLTKQVQEWIKEVKDSGESKKLQPMPAYDRRLIHGLVSKEDNVSTQSQGEGSERYVVIKPS